MPIHLVALPPFLTKVAKAEGNGDSALGDVMSTCGKKPSPGSLNDRPDQSGPAIE